MGSAGSEKKLSLQGAITEVITFSCPSRQVSLPLSHVRVIKVGTSLLPFHTVQKDEG